MNIFRIPDPEGMFFGEIFLIIIVLLFFTNKTCFWNHKEQEKGWFYFSSLFLCTVGSGIRDLVLFYPQDPGSESGMKNIGIRIRDKTSRIRNTAVTYLKISDCPFKSYNF
jgi:hypothetical protein